MEKDAHRRDPERARAGGPVPIRDGCVLDHLGLGARSSKCWEALRKVRTILGWSRQVGSEGVYSSNSHPGHFKGLLTLPGFDYKSLKVEEMKAGGENAVVERRISFSLARTRIFGGLSNSPRLR